MKTITENYDSHTKEELLAEADDRGLTDVKASMSKADIVAALELSDEPKEEKPDSKDALIAELQAQLAELRKAPDQASLIASPTASDLSTYKDGTFKRRSDGVEFQLKIVPDGESNFGRTHLLKNQTNLVEITKEEFHSQFEKP